MSDFDYRSTMLSLCTANLKEMGHFYERLLGVPEEARPNQWLRFRLKGTSLVLWLKADHESPGAASLQLCLVVENLELARNGLQASSLGPIRVASHGRECDLVDPDGNQLILYQPVKT